MAWHIRLLSTSEYVSVSTAQRLGMRSVSRYSTYLPMLSHRKMTKLRESKLRGIRMSRGGGGGEPQLVVVAVVVYESTLLYSTLLLRA